MVRIALGDAQEREDSRWYPMELRAGPSAVLPLLFNQSLAAAQAISKNKALISLPCLKPFNGFSLPLGWGRDFTTVTVGPDIQVSLMLKGIPSKEYPGNSLAVQWLGLCTFTAKGLGYWVTGRGTKIPQAARRGKKKKKKKKT